MFDKLRSYFGSGRGNITRKAITRDVDLDALLNVARETAAGIAVSPELALRCVPVLAAVRVRCETLGSLPLILYRRRDDAGKDRAPDHPLYRLLHDRPNAWTSASEFVMQMEKDTILHGNAFALANRSMDGRILELIRLPHGSVQVERDDYGEPRYRVSRLNRDTTIYTWRDILHVPSLDGLSAIHQAREAIGLALAMEKHAGTMFAKGGKIAGYYKHPGPNALSEEAYQRLKADIRSKETNGEIIITEEGMEFIPVTLKYADQQFAELRSAQVIEICRATGVPPTLLQEFGRATWANAEEMSQAYLTYTLMPRMRLWSGAIARLLSPEEQDEFVADFKAEAIVRADLEKRYAAYATAIAARIINPNEARAGEDMPPYDGGDEFANPNIQLVAPRPQPERAGRRSENQEN